MIYSPSSSQLSTSLTRKKSLFGSTPKKHIEAPFLYQWLGKLQDALVSKVTMYSSCTCYLFCNSSWMENDDDDDGSVSNDLDY